MRLLKTYKMVILNKKMQIIKVYKKLKKKEQNKKMNNQINVYSFFKIIIYN